MSGEESLKPVLSETGARVDAVAEWRAKLAGLAGALLLFLSVSGAVVYLVPFGAFSQVSVLAHTLVGVLALLPISWYVIAHGWVRRKGNLSHYQLIGYASAFMLLVCLVTGLVVTYQGVLGTRIDSGWDLAHLVTGTATFLLIIAHLVTLIAKKVADDATLAVLRSARKTYMHRTLTGCGLLVLGCYVWALTTPTRSPTRAFSSAYEWRFGEGRPFAPSMARLDREEWKEELLSRVGDVVGQEQNAVFQAAFAEHAVEPVGVFEQVRRATTGLILDDAKQSKLEAVLATAALDVRQGGAVHEEFLSRSDSCGTSRCHQQIYEEWLPSAHRYSAMDDMFQRVQTIMAEETSPEHTRYCAGCHDPISLFSGAKSSANITLSTTGTHEGTSCIVCHSIVQADVQGNGDYTLRPPEPYLFEMDEGPVGQLLSDFLIRTYPRHHLESYSRALYKTPEFCAACHKQYVDKEVNTDIGKVQGQNQYDSWRNSRWFHEDSPESTVECRECHMPLIESRDPARGDVLDYNRSAEDGKHRSHRTLASNQYVPLIHGLKGAEEHVALTEQWMRGEMEIPEIADKWTTGPVVRLDLKAPDTVSPGEEVKMQVILTNNKTGHDFPTGPLDMIESWIELSVTDPRGELIYHSGTPDELDRISATPVSYRADGFDRKGDLIDRHNLWDLVGASYKRALFPGAADSVEAAFQCPSMARGRVTEDDGRSLPGRRAEQFAFTPNEQGGEEELTVTARLLYRKANPEFLDRVYGAESQTRSPVTEMTRTSIAIRVAAAAN